MNEKVTQYLNGLFAAYEETTAVKDMKEELARDLAEKYEDLKRQGYDDEAAYRMTIASIGDVSEIMQSIAAKTRELLQLTRKDFSAQDLRNSDLTGVEVHDGKFNSSDLRGSDFSGSDLTNSTFKFCGMNGVRFDGANLTGAKFIQSDLRKASFTACILDHTNFKEAELSGVSFDHLTLNGTIFDTAELKNATFRDAVLRDVSFDASAKRANFDGAKMDKVTYVILRGYGVKLEGVEVLK